MAPKPNHNKHNTEKPKDFKKTMMSLLAYMKPYKVKLFFVGIFAVIGTLFMIVSPKILGSATDTIVTGMTENGNVDFTALVEILFILCAIYLLSAVFSYFQNFIMIGAAQDITYKLRKNLSEKVDRLPLKYYDTKTHGEILSRVTNDIETVNNTLTQSLTQIVTSVCTLIGVLVMMLSINWILTLVALIIIPLSGILMANIVKHSQKYFSSQQALLGKINGHIEEMYTGHVIVKAFNGQEKSIEEFHGVNEKLYQSAWKSQFYSGLMMPIMGLVGNLAYVFVCVMGGFLALRGQVSIGDIQAFLQYVRQFNQPVSQIANIVNIFQSTAAAAERVFQFLEEEEEADYFKPEDASVNITENAKTEEAANSAQDAAAKSKGKIWLNPDTLKGEITFKNVSFGYKEDKMIINDFSYHVPPGQKVAIVGPTGAGKTTIVKLLMRFYELSKGKIEIDGTDIKDMTRHDLRDLFGMVLQDTWLTSGTVMENIRYGKLEATDEEVYAAAKAAHVDHFIHTLPKSYEMEINEDASNISSGQKQLLTIARAILADTPVMILDEATSSVDTRTEILIQKAMNNLMAGRTSFIIAHRLSTIKDADVILVMDQGDVVEKGSHDELMEQNGFYANLYNSQFDE